MTNQGKSNGYRLIYLVATEHKLVVLMTIYYKKEQDDVSETYVKGLIDGLMLHQLPFSDNGDTTDDLTGE